MFWEDFWANYFSSIAAGTTLSLIGLSGYIVYKKNTIQKNRKGDNINQNIGKQQNFENCQFISDGRGITSTATDILEKELTNKITK